MQRGQQARRKPAQPDLLSRRWVQVGLLVLIGLGFATFIGGRGQSALVTLDPLPQDSYIQVYFNQSQANTYTEPYRQVQRYGDDLEQVIVEAIEQAQTSVDVAVHELNLPRIAQALRSQHQAGVEVRLILENNYNQTWHEWRGGGDERSQNRYYEFLALADDNNDGQLSPEEIDAWDAVAILRNASVPKIDDTADGSKGSGLMHHKFVIVDNRWVLTGSANFTTSGVHGDALTPESRGNANVLLKIDSPDLARAYQEEFELMWGSGPGDPEDSQFGLQKPHRGSRWVDLPGSRVKVQFGPLSPTRDWGDSLTGFISRRLAEANHSIDVAQYVFSKQRLGNQLARAAQRGVTIRALVDASFVYRSYSEILDMLGVAIPDHRCRFETNNAPWANPIQTVGRAEVPPGDKMHHKFALIDDRTVIVGSANWSLAANHTNDENLLVIQNPTVAAHFRREFDRLYEDADLGITPRLQQQIQRQRQTCGL
jgi:phosphatidylserine/phosphatidylglycerophosphate/cardiolipin synthase-like enzyme